MTLSIAAGLVALVLVLVVAAIQFVHADCPEYLKICGHEMPGTGVCQRNGGHGGAHSYVTWPKPKAEWCPDCGPGHVCVCLL